MIEPATVQFVSAALYVGCAALLLFAVQRRSPAARRYCYPFVAVVAVAAVAVGFRGAGLGFVPVGVGELGLAHTVGDYVSYPLLFGFAAFVAGASRRYVGVVVVTALVIRIGYDVADLFDGTAGLVGTATILTGYALLVWLYFGPVATAAARQSPRRALFYRKTRNLILFVFGVLIVWAMLQLFGVFDPFTGTMTLEYIYFVLRVGFAAFVIANAETLVDGDSERGDGPLDDGESPVVEGRTDGNASATAD